MRNDAVDDADCNRPIDGRIDLPVLIDVVITATPALCSGLVAGCIEDLRVDPADGAAEHAVAIEHFVVVELHVMSVEADIHLLELPRLGIEVLHLPETALLRRQCSRWMRGAERRLILGDAEAR
jgi:hypothetical protein